MNTKPAYYTGTHHHSFRSGKPALILGVVIARPPAQDWRPCFHVRYPDGVEDYCAISDTAHYTITGPSPPPDPKPKWIPWTKVSQVPTEHWFRTYANPYKCYRVTGTFYDEVFVDGTWFECDGLLRTWEHAPSLDGPWEPCGERSEA